MKIHNEFIIPLPPQQAWAILNDVPRVATCVPGAKLLEQTEDGAYIGTVAVRLGPVALSFKGKFIYKDVDEAARRVRAEANGSEQKARGSARAMVEFVLHEEGAGTRVSVDTDVQLAGSIAQYARGGTLIESTAQVLMDQFAENLRAELNGSPPVMLSQPGDAPAASSSQDANPVSDARPAAPRAAKEISAGTLLYKGFMLTLRRWFGGLFGTRG